jgi:hypothetical protein
VLSLLQSYIDPADPLNHAAAMIPPTTGGHHIFQVYGQKDTYAPPVTEAIYARVAGLGVVIHDSSSTMPDDLGTESNAALTKNMPRNAPRLTGVVRQYAPALASGEGGVADGGATPAYDGHFVAFKNPTAQRDVYRFLDDLAKGLAPTVAP